MPLLKRFDDDLKGALKSSESLKVSVLRMVKAAVKNKAIDKGRELTDDEIIPILSTLIKQRRESIEHYAKAGRDELAQKEEQEIVIIQAYMPKQLSHAEIDSLIRNAISESSAKNSQDLGKVMRLLMPKVKGFADGAYINQRVKELLESQS
jgi:uncharacterized protein YqeY